MEPQVEDYQFDGVEVRLRTREVLCQGKPVSIEPKAFRVLVYLIQNRDRAIGKDELIEKVWDGVAVTDNALSRIVAQLRKELGDDARQPRYIQTLPTLGYRFVAEISPRVAPSPPARRRSKLLPAAGILIAIGALAAAWLYAIRRPVIPPPQPRPVQITTSPGLDLNGSFSPDGSSLAYSSNRSGHFEIYLHPLDARGRELQVTADGNENVDPAWSPDGSAIAFHSARRRGICIVPAMGGAARQITTFGSQPAWSPDSQWIAFESSVPRILSPFTLHHGDYQSTIWIVARDGSGLRQVTKLSHIGEGSSSGDRGPSWWPDGKRILFSAGGRLSIADVASGKSELLTQPARVWLSYWT
jgi:DNA-binding winged helix-turn-helix (wHTH) protein